MTASGSNSQEIVPTAPAPGSVVSAPAPAGNAHPRANPPPAQGAANYDEQLSETFTQGFTSMLYNVSAVEQTDPSSGTGPAYLLNGLAPTGYWYQVGLAWNWNPGYYPGTGFDMLYEVFDSSGNSVFPSSNGAGLVAFTRAVSPGDPVALNLYIRSDGTVVMLAEDMITLAYAQATYSAEGATSFVGLASSPLDPNGFFTGLMTEWYHAAPYYGDESTVPYQSSFALSSVWFWIDEYVPSSSSVQFYAKTPSPVSLAPGAVQTFTSNGATVFGDPYVFATGTGTYTPMTFSYSVQGGGASYSAPVLTFYLHGSPVSTQLSTSPLWYVVDTGTQWSVSADLGGSGASERWATSQPTSGAASMQTLSLVYYHQYLQSFDYSLAGGGSPTEIMVSYSEFGAASIASLGTSPAGYWMDSGSTWSVEGAVTGAAGERWADNGATSGTVASSSSQTLAYQHQYYVASAISPPGGGTAGLASGWADAGSTVNLGATPNSGWQFEGWSGTGSGAYSGTGTSFTLTGPANETATFYPGLTISVSGGGSVQYSYGGTKGTVSSSQTIYVPAGTSVALTASTPSFFSSFGGWGGVASGGGSTQQVQVSSPGALTASFGTNYVVVGGLAAVVILAVLGLALFMRRRGKGAAGMAAMPPPPPPMGTTEPPAAGQSATFCPNCGSPIPAGSSVCGKCGQAV